MSVYRERDRFDDTRSVASQRTSGGTKVTRYVVKEDDYDNRSRFDESRRSHYDDSRSYAASRYDDRRTDYDRGDNRVEETKIIRTTREESPQRAPSRAYSARDPGYDRSRETITIRREESSPERKREYWREPPGEPVEDRELVIRRTVERDDKPRERELAVTRVDDRRDSRYSDYEMVSPHRDSLDDREREVQRYIRHTDYYQPPAPQPPQTIIIRQEPIIIRERERPREEDYQIVKKSDVEEERSVVRRQPPEEEYFFEKKVRERIPDDRGERRLTRREVSPGDSISQAGRHRRDRGYDSDDSMVYVRKEKITEEYASDDDGHRRRDLAAGAVAGIGAAELIRRHHEKEGKEVARGGGRVARDVGAGLVGVVAAEGIRRYRSKSRRRGSRSRSRSGSRGRYSRRGGSRHRSRSRSGSNNNLKNIGGLGLAAAAVAAGALIASRGKKDASPDRRSRSRTRRSSRGRSTSRASSRASLENDPTASDDRNPKVRNKKTAAAGALGAAAMALYERHRSKSRGRTGSRSPNRIKQGLPIAGAGLAAAGLANMYERRKAKEEADDIIKDEHRRARSRTSRSRSRGRTESTYFDGPQRSAYSDPNLVAYGTEPLHGNNFGQGYYGRPGVEQDYYNNSTRAMVPAPGPPPAASSYDATARRPRSSSRTRSVSSSRSRSRSRGAAAAAAAVGAGVAASEIDKRRKEKKERKRRSRDRQREREGSYAPYTEGRDPYEDANWHATHSASYAQGMNDPYASQSGFYPSTNQFPPPPGAVPPQQGYGAQQAPNNQPAYAAQNFPPPPAGTPQAQQPYYDPYAPNQNPYAPRARGDENVSAASSSAPLDQHHPTSNGVSSTREMAMSPPVVGPNVTVQRPSTSTPMAQAPGNRFPGDVSNPFQRSVPLDQPQPRRSSISNEASPGQTPGRTSPVRPTSRAAQAYTPPQPVPRTQRERSASAGPQSRRPPVVTDAPSPLRQEKQPIPEDPRVTAFRNAAYNAPTPSAADGKTKAKQPEMQQTNRGKIPFMPSPDIRPPSDPNLLQPNRQVSYLNSNDNAPSLPSLTIPEQPSSSSFIPPTEERSRRERSRSQSAPRRSSSTPGDMTPRAQSPGQDHPKKSVSFASKPEFSDAPSTISQNKDKSGSDTDTNKRRSHSDRDRDRRRSHDRDRERDRDPDRSHDRDRDPDHRHSREHRGYDGGDDMSEDTPFEDARRRSHDRSDRGSRHSSRRERSNTQSLDRDSGRDPDRDRDRRDPKRSSTTSSSSKKGRQGGEDDVEDLPDRFDEQGRRKPDSSGEKSRSADEELLAETLDQILGKFWPGGSGSKKH